MTDSDLRGSIKEHFEEIAPKYDFYKQRRATYHQALKALVLEVFPDAREQALLDIGCGTGELLAVLGPRRGIGLDFSAGMVEAAQGKFADRGLHFVQGEAERLPFADSLPVDGILSLDTIEHFHDPGEALAELARVAGPETRILLSWANPLWEPLLELFERLNLKMPEGPHNWPGIDEIKERVRELGLQIDQEGYRLLVPGDLGGVSRFINARFMHWPVLRKAGLIQFLVLRKR